MRGRLINPFKAKIARIDTDGSAADPDGAGELTSGYDPVFREPIRQQDNTLTTKYLDPILVPCQFEPDDQFDALDQQSDGNDTNSRVRVVCHFEDLEQMGLVDPTTGDALFRLNDRLQSIHRFDDETLIQRASITGDLYCVEVKPVSFGLSGGSRNLLILSFETRNASYKGAS